MAQGRCSAMLAVAVLLVSAAAVVHGTTYTVGDAQGWTVPDSPTFYADWAANKTFVAGDALLFKYNKAGHNVLTVTATEYAACTITSTNRVQTGNDSIVLVAGANSFLCGIPGHCQGGQKLTVSATAGTPNPITPPGPPTTPGAPANTAVAGNAVTAVQVLAAVAVSAVALLTL